jgi:hypothetical protein
MSTERAGFELLRAFWNTLQAMDMDLNVAGPNVLLAADRLIAGESPDVLAKEIRSSLPAHMLEPQDAVERFIRDRNLRNARRPSPLGG